MKTQAWWHMLEMCVLNKQGHRMHPPGLWWCPQRMYVKVFMEDTSLGVYGGPWRIYVKVFMEGTCVGLCGDPQRMCVKVSVEGALHLFLELYTHFSRLLSRVSLKEQTVRLP